MRLRRLGESLIILQDLPAPAVEVAHNLCAQGLPGLIEAVPAFDQVGVYFDPDVFDKGLLDSDFDRIQANNINPSHFKIPILFDGLDMDRIRDLLRISAEELTSTITKATFTVEAIGFCPGFPYLSGLPVELQGLTRLDSPRAAVPPGSLAIVGDQACIYPQATPGGWNIIGRTSMVICDPDQDFFPLAVGDTIQFVDASEEELDQMEGQCIQGS
ncbi:MAG: carboxyltransferase domain-containing protein [Fimbriimonadaceae bacterium]|nr:MAG: carboxyltransferase domain-containing protein [Fimbriimonadaceae bacterium]